MVISHKFLSAVFRCSTRHRPLCFYTAGPSLLNLARCLILLNHICSIYMTNGLRTSYIISNWRNLILLDRFKEIIPRDLKTHSWSTPTYISLDTEEDSTLKLTPILSCSKVLFCPYCYCPVFLSFFPLSFLLCVVIWAEWGWGVPTIDWHPKASEKIFLKKKKKYQNYHVCNYAGDKCN